ncbi:MAG: serine hydrolase [Pirellulales bacterium]
MHALSLTLALALVLPAADDSATPETSQLDAQAAEILRSLPGESAFAFTSLAGGKPTVIIGVRADERLAVGSSFKLFILGTLIDEVNRGRRRAADVMLLRRELVGPPASELAAWPVRSPVTLHTLALKMISISDNTATDHLLYLLGRKRIERQMAAMGHGDPAVNRPLLSTREMTLLRDKRRGLPGRGYRQLDEAARRKLLAELDAGVPDYDQLDFDASAYSMAEWYASPRDMAAALGWIAARTEPDQPAHDLLAILTVETKLPHDPTVWPFVGFKGGSEDQIMAGNWLLEHKNGQWYTLHLYWNNPAGAADPRQFLSALTKLLSLAEGAIE